MSESKNPQLTTFPKKSTKSGPKSTPKPKRSRLHYKLPNIDNKPPITTPTIVNTHQSKANLLQCSTYLPFSNNDHYISIPFQPTPQLDRTKNLTKPQIIAAIDAELHPQLDNSSHKSRYQTDIKRLLAFNMTKMGNYFKNAKPNQAKLSFDEKFGQPAQKFSYIPFYLKNLWNQIGQNVNSDIKLKQFYQKYYNILSYYHPPLDERLGNQIEQSATAIFPLRPYVVYPKGKKIIQLDRKVIDTPSSKFHQVDPLLNGYNQPNPFFPQYDSQNEYYSHPYNTYQGQYQLPSHSSFSSNNSTNQTQFGYNPQDIVQKSNHPVYDNNYGGFPGPRYHQQYPQQQYPSQQQNFNQPPPFQKYGDYYNHIYHKKGQFDLEHPTNLSQNRLDQQFNFRQQFNPNQQMLLTHYEDDELDDLPTNLNIHPKFVSTPPFPTNINFPLPDPSTIPMYLGTKTPTQPPQNPQIKDIIPSNLDNIQSQISNDNKVPDMGQFRTNIPQVLDQFRGYHPKDGPFSSIILRNDQDNAARVQVSNSPLRDNTIFQGNTIQRQPLLAIDQIPNQQPFYPSTAMLPPSNLQDFDHTQLNKTIQYDYSHPLHQQPQYYNSFSRNQLAQPSRALYGNDIPYYGSESAYHPVELRTQQLPFRSQPFHQQPGNQKAQKLTSQSNIHPEKPTSSHNFIKNDNINGPRYPFPIVDQQPLFSTPRWNSRRKSILSNSPEFGLQSKAFIVKPIGNPLPNYGDGRVHRKDQLSIDYSIFPSIQFTKDAIDGIPSNSKVIGNEIAGANHDLKIMDGSKAPTSISLLPSRHRVSPSLISSDSEPGSIKIIIDSNSDPTTETPTTETPTPESAPTSPRYYTRSGRGVIEDSSDEDTTPSTFKTKMASFNRRTFATQPRRQGFQSTLFDLQGRKRTINRDVPAHFPDYSLNRQTTVGKRLENFAQAAGHTSAASVNRGIDSKKITNETPTIPIVRTVTDVTTPGSSARLIGLQNPNNRRTALGLRQLQRHSSDNLVSQTQHNIEPLSTPSTNHASLSHHSRQHSQQFDQNRYHFRKK
jgi:hypothetical protein